MAEHIEDKNEKNSPFHFYSGISEEIFKKLPKQDQRPYIIIGSLNFYITILFSALIYLIADRYNIIIFLKILITILSLGGMVLLQRKLTQRLIHQFDTGSRIFFWCSGAIIASLFIISVVNGWVINDRYYDESYMTTTTDSTTTTTTDTTIVDTTQMMKPIEYDSTKK